MILWRSGKHSRTDSTMTQYTLVHSSLAEVHSLSIIARYDCHLVLDQTCRLVEEAIWHCITDLRGNSKVTYLHCPIQFVWNYYSMSWTVDPHPFDQEVKGYGLRICQLIESNQSDWSSIHCSAWKFRRWMWWSWPWWIRRGMWEEMKKWAWAAQLQILQNGPSYR